MGFRAARRYTTGMYAFAIVGILGAMLAVGQWGAGAPPELWVALSGLAVVVALVGLAGLCISAFILWRRGEVAAGGQRFLAKVRLLGRVYRLLVLVAYGLVLRQLGWAALAYDLAGRGTWDCPAMAIAIAPFLVLCVAAWTAVYWAERVLRAAMFEQAGAVVAAGEWTLSRYLEFMFRQYVLVFLVPLLVLLGIDDALVHAGYSPDSGVLGFVLFLATTLAAVLLAGVWVRICWRTEPLPEGDLRRRLYGLAERAGVRVGNVLVWRTNLSIANGCMIGMVGPLRYIMITDALLLAMSQAPEEAEAVFAHEIAHVKYRHTLLYVALMAGAFGAAMLAGEAAATLSDAEWAPGAATGAVLVGYLGLVFGYISRRCELEADLYAARATECPVNCSPPDPGFAAGQVPAGAEDWAAATSGRSLCPHRVLALTAALERIARLNGMAYSARGWRHFSIARRCDVLAGLLADPAGIARYERRIRRLKRVALAASLAIAAAAGGYVWAASTSETHHPEHPARPEYIIPGEPIYRTHLIDRHQVDAVAFGTPEFHRDADAAADLDDGRLAGLGRDVAAADDQVAVADARGHAVAVDAQGKRPGAEGAEAGQFKVLQDPVGRRGG